MVATAMGIHIPIQVSLMVIFTCLALAVAASVLVSRKPGEEIIPIDP
jgi:hypothetical protein